jgi:hypothetical protein
MAGPLPPADDGPERDDRDRAGASSADASERDRQILVVGDDLAAAATAGFLEQAGLDPVLASAAGERARSNVAVCWHPALALLERLGLRRPVERRGRALTRLERTTSGQSWAADPDARPTLVAIREATLQEILVRHLLGRVRTTERAVTAVETDGGGVRATFAQGIEEPFDAVVTTDRSLLWPPARRPTALHVWEFAWPTGVPAPEAPTEAWAETAAAVSVPATDGHRGRLVSTTGTDPVAAISSAGLTERFGHLFDAGSSPLGALDDGAFEYRRLPAAVPASLAHGRVAFVGPAARTAVPGSCIGPAVDVEDAWVIADTLAYGPPAIDDALAAYERRRHRRLADLWAHADDAGLGTRVATDLAPPLQRLCAARTLAFSHAIDGQQPAFARAVPESL